MKKKEGQVFFDLCLTIKRANICVTEKQEKDEGQKSIGIMIEISPNLVKSINLQNLKKKKKQPKKKLKKLKEKNKFTPRHILIRFLTTSYKEKNLLKVVQDRRACYTQIDRNDDRLLTRNTARQETMERLLCRADHKHYSVIEFCIQLKFPYRSERQNRVTHS